mmetsp:Transcript_10910/g.32698  ORF Transcript_10910/g.32698 Transcript_10910/m.32698 type:complete len:477 (-) Transcript_10910:470-1900(-)|eukprot:CAMPEP_0206138710 /NCGR_PEP_ID=MMETSP1473-20131121/3509_1 /ASSEMBLY_ACC=CAM_ASM_001109 /TAXON_ID=1461547 /ORGANISM="Stichococcus sp, Strain RCC1054" /LENGTH=476 /DNA_ID=CAMNT_0053532213 /DNA_START=216 /DNA_END=1646 /DNA_ORIENTATION=-
MGLGDWVSTRRRKYDAANFNVKLLLWFTFLETAATSVSTGDILSAYLFMLSGSNATVGYIQGVKGTAMMVLSVPAGWMADRWRRDGVLVTAAVLGAVASAVLAVATFVGAPLWMLYLSMGLMGAYSGANNPATESLFADSVIAGASSQLYTLKFTVGNVASTCGPLISIVLFAFVGNSWEEGTCRAVVVIGLAMMVVPLVLLCFANDDKCLGLSSESLHDVQSCASLTDVPSVESKWAVFGSWTIPALISISDLIGAFASGMTIKFFYLFFAEEVGLSPIAASSISVASPLCINLVSLILQRSSVWAGRVQVTLVSKALDVLLMVALAYMPTHTGNLGMTLALIAVQLTRGAMANASRPLMRSVLMDNVPKRMRARFNALESVKSFSWSGSAVFGGLMIQKYGFQHTFLITAGLRTLSFLPIVPLLALVKDDLHRDVAGHVTRQPIRDVSTDQLPLMADDVQQPLLNGDLDGKADH